MSRTRSILAALLALSALRCATPRQAAATAAAAPEKPAPAPAPAPKPLAHTWNPGDPIPSLAKAYQGQLLVGAAVRPGMVVVGETAAFLEHQFAVITLEDELKPVNVSRREGRYELGMADLVVDWAVKKGIKVRGHCLVWHQQAAPWIFTQDGKPVSREVLIQRLRTYIHEVVGHFKGRVWAWDVVQEAFAPGEPGIETVDGWRRSPWYDVIGPEYVELAFRFAHEADPGAILVYNDYATEAPRKRAMILELVKSLQAKGLPVAVGHQSHYQQEAPAVAALEAAIQELDRIGVKSQITELDLSMRPTWGAPMPAVTPELRESHALRYLDFFRMFRRNQAALQAVVVWGVNDESSWLRVTGSGVPDAPLLFSEWQPKPEFWAVYDEASR